MPGPAPKPNRRRRNADTYADVRTVVPAEVDSLHGPTLEDATGGLLADVDPVLAKLVENWWTTWRKSPLAEAFLDTDWSRLAMLAPLVASYFARPHYTKLAEIRQNESLLGATHVDRLKARIQVNRAPAAPPAAPGVTALDDYRSRLSG